jgi:RNA polymerase sigma factor (sigma-70 family)
MATATKAVLQRVLQVSGEADLTDRVLLQRFVNQSDQAAFATLFRRHASMVLAVCRRALPTEPDAEDACQATFLLLSRKANSARWQASVANWLYLTARRVARNARIMAERRARHEGRAALARLSQPVDRMTGRELLNALDEELDRLPTVYREPLVLCYLEGLTRDEAAVRLGLPLATIKARLERGRKRLGEALTMRGCVAGAGLLMLASTTPARSAPPTLLPAMLRAIGGTPSAASANLSDLSCPCIGKIGMAMACLSSIGVAILAFALVSGRPSASGAGDVSLTSARPVAFDDEKSPAHPQSEAENSLSGRVLGVDGKPVAGAKLIYFGYVENEVLAGTSGADGRFLIKVPKEMLDRYLVATADGSGLDFLNLREVDDKQDLELRLSKDHPINGRVVDTQGKPVRGIEVRVTHVGVYGDDSLDTFLADWKKMNAVGNMPPSRKSLWLSPLAVLATKTDGDGRFVIHGAGRERVVRLQFRGGGMAEMEALVVNREGLDLKPYDDARRANTLASKHVVPLYHLFGPNSGFVVEPEKIIRGKVVARDTGLGRPGIEVFLRSVSDKAIFNWLKATTDADGHYEIHGGPRGKSYTIEVHADTTSGYVGTAVTAADTPGYDPVSADIRVGKGIIVTGRVIDNATGKGIPSFVYIDPLNGNTYATHQAAFPDTRLFGPGRTTNDGSFRLVTVPGPVLLMAEADMTRLPEGIEGIHRYRLSQFDPKYPQYFTKSPAWNSYLSTHGRMLVQGNWCKVLDVKPDATIIQQDALLERATALPILLRDPAGQPLRGVRVKGASAVAGWHSPFTCKSDACAAYDVEPGKPRMLVFFEPSRKLAATVRVAGDEKAPIVVTLRPTGTFKGRLVDEEGSPLAGIEVRVNYSDRAARGVDDDSENVWQRVVTEADGSFVIDAVLPGLPCSLKFNRRQTVFAPATEPISVPMVDSGETKDLGTIAMKPRMNGS